MAIIPVSELREVKGIEPSAMALIGAYMQGAIYSWVKNLSDRPFSVRDLVGGENYDWNGTPLIVLYEKHMNQGKDEDSAVKAAGIDLGWIVKSLLSEDKRTFDVGTNGLVKTYRWVGNEP